MSDARVLGRRPRHSPVVTSATLLRAAVILLRPALLLADAILWPICRSRVTDGCEDHSPTLSNFAADRARGCRFPERLLAGRQPISPIP